MKTTASSFFKALGGGRLGFPARAGGGRRGIVASNPLTQKEIDFIGEMSGGGWRGHEL